MSFVVPVSYLHSSETLINPELKKKEKTLINLKSNPNIQITQITRVPMSMLTSMTGADADRLYSLPGDMLQSPSPMPTRRRLPPSSPAGGADGPL